jgi:hypothetical protein
VATPETSSPAKAVTAELISMAVAAVAASALGLNNFFNLFMIYLFLRFSNSSGGKRPASIRSGCSAGSFFLVNTTVRLNGWNRNLRGVSIPAICYPFRP